MGGPGPALDAPDGDDPNADYIPTAAVLATLPSRNPNLPPDPTEDVPGEQFNVEVEGPVLRAAEMPDIRILRGLLRHGFPPINYMVGPLHGPWRSALTNAIQARLPEHASLLLEHGANPNGYPDACFLIASSRFIRGRDATQTLTAGCALRPRDIALKSLGPNGLASAQIAALTDAELDQRRSSRARFWAEPDFPRVDWPTNNPISALSAAVGVQNPELYSLLIQHGADEAAWTTESSDFHPAVGTHVPSRWAVEPPLWVAIKNKDEEMLRFLLDRGHKPHIFPEALITRSWNALAYAISTNWTAGFDMMSTTSNLSLVSPVFGCHLLHFAVATLDLELVRFVVGKFQGGEDKLPAIAPVTALGHTLLHIASLPLDDSNVNMHSLPVYTSIYEFRTLDTTWRPIELSANTTTRGRGPPTRAWTMPRGRQTTSASRGPSFRDVPQHQLSAQAEVILYLLELLPEEQTVRQDIHGNTFLHYLASIRNPDEVLLARVRAHPAGERGWHSLPNAKGFTASNLFQAGQTARSDWDKQHMPFWRQG